MRRFLDFISALFLLIIFSPLLLVIAVLIRLSSSGEAVYVSDRIGRHNIIFKMYKFRTMRKDTPQVASHLMADPRKYLTPVGSFLRKTSLDELPQLFNILKGDMSFVGPRPALFNQDDLIQLRTSKGVHEMLPGVTGWAQTHGRDDLSISDKVALDEYYLKNSGIILDFKIICLTILKVLSCKNVLH